MDVEKIKRKYHRNVRFYDWAVGRPTAQLRQEAVRRLGLRPGQRALDLGCGTGLSLPLLHAAVSNAGAVYGVELSTDMLAVARRRAATGGWQNVRLIEADAERFELEQIVDAILCFYTHDIMLSPSALPRALKFLRPGGQVVAAGAKLVRGWRGWLINPITVAYSLPAVTTLDATLAYEPYAVMRMLLREFRIQELKLGSQYLAWGTFAPPSADSSASGRG